MKKKLIISVIMAVLLIMLVGVAACNSQGSAGGLSQQEVVVERGDLTVSVSGNGKIESSSEARLTFGSGGKVERVLIKEGDTVRFGDTLAVLETNTLELALKQTEMGLTQAEVALAQAEFNLRSAEHNLDSMKRSGDSLQLALVNTQIARDTAQISLSSGIAAVSYASVEADLNKARAWYEYTLRKVSEDVVNADDWLLAVDRAKDALDAAQAVYNNSLAGYDSSQVNLKKKQLEAAELSVALAQKNIDELEGNITLQQVQVTALERAVKQAAQAVELAEQSVIDAKKQLDEATITAPFDGVVATCYAKEGDILPSPSLAATPVIYIVDPALLALIIEVDEIDIPDVKTGQTADVSIDALPDKTIRGEVIAVYPVPVEVGGIVLYKVKIRLDVAGDTGIKVGMSASSDILVERHVDVLIVPSRAVVQNDQGKDIVKVKVSGQIEEREVVLGLDDGLKTEIVSGLIEGETVIYEVKVKSASGMNLF